jgi:hypothetical protein
VFPNPLLQNQSLIISFDKDYATAIYLSIYDVTGKQVFAKTVNVNTQREVKLDHLDLPTGIYTVRLNNDYLNSTKKIVIE